MSAEQERERFDAWFDREYPHDADKGREKYRKSSVGELMLAAWQARAAFSAPTSMSAEPEAFRLAGESVKRDADAFKAMMNAPASMSAEPIGYVNLRAMTQLANGEWAIINPAVEGDATHAVFAKALK